MNISSLFAYISSLLAYQQSCKFGLQWLAVEPFHHKCASNVFVEEL